MNSVVSFDLWGTLIKSNPVFKEKREKCIREIFKKHRVFNYDTDLDSLDLGTILKEIKKDVDNLVEKYGLSATPYNLYEGLISTIIRRNSGKIRSLTHEDVKQIVIDIIAESDKLLENSQNQPNLIESDTKDQLYRLLDSGGKLVVMSNTMNMSGNNLRDTLLSRLGEGLFSEMFFSDQVGASKPSPAMYGKLLDFAGENYVTHIGDNLTTDGQVVNYGIGFMQINPKSDENNLSGIISSILNGNKGKSNISLHPFRNREIHPFDLDSRRLTVQKFSGSKDMNFLPEEYSRFKHGSKVIAKKYGEELAEKLVFSPFFEEIIEGVKQGKKIIVVSSPYIYVPTATYAMKDYFVSRFNQMLAGKVMDPVVEVKMSRRASYRDEYGEMSAEERSKVMQNDIFHIDHEFIRGNIVLFIDDIIITGGHEKRVMKMLEHYDLVGGITPVFLYYAMLTDRKTDPKIENYLNYAAVGNLIDLNNIIANEPFALNTRMLKYILNSPYEECKSFLSYQKDIFLHTLYSAALGNRYNQIPEYKPNFEYLEFLLRAKGLVK